MLLEIARSGTTKTDYGKQRRCRAPYLLPYLLVKCHEICLLILARALIFLAPRSGLRCQQLGRIPHSPVKESLLPMMDPKNRDYEEIPD